VSVWPTAVCKLATFFPAALNISRQSRSASPPGQAKHTNCFAGLGKTLTCPVFRTSATMLGVSVGVASRRIGVDVGVFAPATLVGLAVGV